MNTRVSDSLLAVKRRGLIPVIPDIKLRSPKEGDLLGARSPVDYALSLKEAGAPALSVVTETKLFDGSAELLRRVAEATGLPVLRKDFIKTADQVRLTADLGAAAILLIVSMLDERTLNLLFETALKAGLEPLVETHSAQEIELANRLQPSFVGINNRDILRMECDGGTVSKTAELAGKIRPGAVILSESAISGTEDVRRAIRSGADAVLVGTALLKAKDATALFKEMTARMEV